MADAARKPIVHAPEVTPAMLAEARQVWIKLDDGTEIRVPEITARLLWLVMWQAYRQGTQ
jgi:hypothetical protein